MGTRRHDRREQLTVMVMITVLTFLMVAEEWADLGVPTWIKVGVWMAGIAIAGIVCRVTGRGAEPEVRQLSTPTFRILFFTTLFAALLVSDLVGDRYGLAFWSRMLIVLGFAMIGAAAIAGLRAWWMKTRWSHGRTIRKWPPGEGRSNG